MTKTYDAAGNVTRRVVEHDGWTITQVPQPNGEWWNLRIERTSK